MEMEKSYRFPDGSKYDGETINSQHQGWGNCILVNGDCYTGEWVADKRTGWGTYRYSNGDLYLGEWLDEKRCGWGIYVYNKTNKQTNKPLTSVFL